MSLCVHLTIFSFPVQAGKEKILPPQGKITHTSRKVYDHHN